MLQIAVQWKTLKWSIPVLIMELSQSSGGYNNNLLINFMDNTYYLITKYSSLRLTTWKIANGFIFLKCLFMMLNTEKREDNNHANCLLCFYFPSYQVSCTEYSEESLSQNATK